jgi:hypothetical protein
MKKERDHIQDITEMRSMMERSSKFMSLSGWAGVMAGIYALAGAWIAYAMLDFNPDAIFYTTPNLPKVIFLALGILILAFITAIYFSRKKAKNKGEKIWNATSRRLLVNMAVPLLTGGVLTVILISKGLIGFITTVMLLFYGLALFNAGNFTIIEVRLMGLVQIILGLINIWFIEYSLLLWAVGFGVVHIVYGIYMHFRYER